MVIAFQVEARFVIKRDVFHAQQTCGLQAVMQDLKQPYTCLFRVFVGYPLSQIEQIAEPHYVKSLT